MIVLCDTCVILMLLRIVPNMFRDKEYQCITVPSVSREFTRTQKFKSKYPWRNDFKKYIISRPITLLKSNDFNTTHAAVKTINDTSYNSRTKKKYSLSPVDCELAAITAHNNYSISTVDRNLGEFIEQQFESINYEPLDLINIWLIKKLIRWDDHKQTILNEWIICGEKYPSYKAVKEFNKISGYTFPK